MPNHAPRRRMLVRFILALWNTAPDKHAATWRLIISMIAALIAACIIANFAGCTAVHVKPDGTLDAYGVLTDAGINSASYEDPEGRTLTLDGYKSNKTAALETANKALDLVD